MLKHSNILTETGEVTEGMSDRHENYRRSEYTHIPVHELTPKMLRKDTKDLTLERQRNNDRGMIYKSDKEIDEICDSVDHGASVMASVLKQPRSFVVSAVNNALNKKERPSIKSEPTNNILDFVDNRVYSATNRMGKVNNFTSILELTEFLDNKTTEFKEMYTGIRVDQVMDIDKDIYLYDVYRMGELIDYYDITVK